MRRDTAAPHFEQVPFRGMRLLAVDGVLRIAIWRIMFWGVRCVPGSLLVLGGSWRLVKTMQKIDAETLPKSSKKGLDGVQNHEKWIPNPCKILKKSSWGCPLGALWRQVGASETRPGGAYPILIFSSAFWRHLADLGRHFGPSWLPKGSQNHSFLAWNLKKMRKRAPKNDARKNMKFRLIFDAKMGGPDRWLQSSRSMLVAF